MSAIFERSPVVPVVVIEDVADAAPLARALHAGGVSIIEVTLRSASALDAVRVIADEAPDVLVGAGTVCSAAQAADAAAAGAQFLLSPGSTDRLLDAMAETGLPNLSGVATPSEMLRLLERGITQAKLFPAAAVGGLSLLKAVQGPLPGLRFCPTGGVTAENAAQYLALPNVMCVGGSWLTPASLVRARDWAAITELARAASALAGGGPVPAPV